MSIVWNPWHGCTKLSEGCANCYMFRRDAEYGKDSTIVTKTSSFHMPFPVTSTAITRFLQEKLYSPALHQTSFILQLMHGAKTHGFSTILRMEKICHLLKIAYPFWNQ